jgi:hypothetical protein
MRRVLAVGQREPGEEGQLRGVGLRLLVVVPVPRAHPVEVAGPAVVVLPEEAVERARLAGERARLDALDDGVDHPEEPLATLVRPE